MRHLVRAVAPLFILLAATAAAQEIMPSPTPSPSPTPTPTPPPSGIKVVVPPGAVSASTNDGNLPANTVDGSLLTRWSGYGNGAWLRFDLGTSRRVSHVRVAAHLGNQRSNFFDIQTSADGVAWVDAATGLQTSGTSTQLEIFDLLSDPTARYVRYVGRGNSDPAKAGWNSVTEMEVYEVSAAAPPAPTGLRATPGAGRVALEWQATGASSFRISRRLSQCDSFVQVGTSTTMTFVDTTVVDGRHYYYHVIAVNAAGPSVPSSPIAVTPQLQRPTAPNLTAASAAGRVDLSWTIFPDTATQFTIRRALRPSCWPNAVPTWTSLATADNPARTYSDTTAQPFVQYLYSVVASNAAGPGPSSNIVEASASGMSAMLTPTVTPTQPTPCPTGTPTPPPPNPSATPPAPNPVSVENGNGRVQITWTPAGTYPDIAFSYSVYRSLNACGPYQQVARFLTGTRYVDGGLVNGTTYYYIVVGVNTRGESLDSDIVAAIPDAVPPRAPSGLGATVIAGPAVRLSWYESFADSYNVKRSTTRGGPYQTIATGIPTGSGTTRTWDDTSVSGGATYYYVVTASNTPGGESGNSNEAEARVPGGLVAPVLRAGPHPWDVNQVVLNWTAVDGATSYRIRSSPSSCTGFTDLATVSATTHTYTTTVLALRYFVVIAVAGVESPPSNVVASAPRYTADSMAFHAILEDGKVRLTWPAVAGATGYVIQRARYVQPPPSCWPQPTPVHYELLATTTGTGHLDATVSGGATYLYRIRAMVNGREDDSGAASIDVPGFQLGPTPTPPRFCPTPTPTSTPAPTPTPHSTPGTPAVTAVGGHQKVDLNWAPVGPSVMSYRVYRGTAACGPYQLIAQFVSEPRFVDSGLTNGTPYYYVVTAHNSLGEGPHSAERSAAGGAGPPSPVAGLHREPATSRVVLRWKPSYTAVDYVVRRQGAVIGTVTTDAFTDSTGVPGVTYSYAVSPRNAFGEGPAVGVEAAATDAPMPPTGVSASLVANAIQVQWTASSGATQYRVYRHTEATGWFDPKATVTGTSWLDPGPFMEGQRYYYRVSALSTLASDPSEAASIVYSASSLVEVTPPASGVTASTSDSNLPGNTVDGSLATRWSGNGVGAWIEYDIGSVRRVARITVAVYGGNARKNAFELRLSRDRTTWTTVFNGQSSGTTTQEEAYDAFTPEDARYVRYVGKGAVFNAGGTTTWNSVSEVSVYAVPVATPTPTPTPVCATPPPSPTAPPPPSNVTATGGEGQVTVRWTSSYHRNRVLRSTTSGGPYEVIADLTNSAQGEYVDRAVEVGRRYFYRVQVFDQRTSEPGCPPWTWTLTSPPSAEVWAVPTGAGGCVKWTPAQYIVTSSTHDGNLPGNTVDGNLATRWSANGDPQWLRFDLQITYTVCYVKIAFYRGNERVYRFDLQSSTGGGIFTTLRASAQSSGTTTGLETFDFPDASARELRYIGHGNSVNTFNSVTEFEIWVVP